MWRSIAISAHAVNRVMSRAVCYLNRRCSVLVKSTQRTRKPTWPLSAKVKQLQCREDRDCASQCQQLPCYKLMVLSLYLAVNTL